MLCLNLIIPNITPGGLFSGELIHGRSFPFQKLVPKRPRAYTRWDLLSEFYGMLKHCLPLKTFIPVFVAFFVLLGITLSCIRKMLSSVTSAKREFTLPGGGHCPLIRDSEPIRLLEIPMSQSLYMLINN